MKKTIGLYDFRSEFEACNRDNNFSYEGLEALFNWCEELDEEMELDVIALCCDFNEDSYSDVANNYNIDITECEDDDEIKETVIDYLNDNTSVLAELDESVLYATF